MITENEAQLESHIVYIKGPSFQSHMLSHTEPLFLLRHVTDPGMDITTVIVTPGVLRMLIHNCVFYIQRLDSSYHIYTVVTSSLENSIQFI